MYITLVIFIKVNYLELEKILNDSNTCGDPIITLREKHVAFYTS